MSDINSPSYLNIIHQDDCILAINKPCGLSTQAPPGFDSLESRVRNYVKQSNSKNANFYLGVPHRLDRAVSGVILFALTPRAARKLSQQFERRTIRKRYWACVEGNIIAETGIWIDFIRKVPDEPRAEIVSENYTDSQRAVLHFQRLRPIKLHSKSDATTDGTLLEITLETGRMHQIRLQAASRNHAIAGDKMYGSSSNFGNETDDPSLHGIALHAREIEFQHPTLQKRIAVTAEVSDEWKKLAIG